FLKEHPAVAAEIETALRQNAGLIAGALLEGEPEPDADGEGFDAAADG
ncbi:MAG TPA: DNA recombination/repair protein RecA, partial [Rhizobiaceae bacterium]|nr:DNA recombination/repair protein RecA [Rhizobiaceae bacterium]